MVRNNPESHYRELLSSVIQDQSTNLGQTILLDNYSQLRFFPETTMQVIVLDQDILKSEGNGMQIALTALKQGVTRVQIQIQGQFGNITTSFQVAVL